MSSADDKVALVVGATGLVGRELVTILRDFPGWKTVYGVARNNNIHPPRSTTSSSSDADADADADADGNNNNVVFVGCDLLDREAALRELGPLAERVTHLFWVTWASRFPLDTHECCDQNRAMLSNALDAMFLPGGGSSTLRHVSLQTGTKHYVSLGSSSSSSSSNLQQQLTPSSSDAAAAAANNNCYYDEESPRVPEALNNFYYALEDLVKERLAARRTPTLVPVVGWSVHRPGLVLGASRRSHFNVVGSLCVYASICRHLGLPFLFGGDRRCWEEPCMDASDARIIAGQHVWWAEEEEEEARRSSSSQLLQDDAAAFNAVNVDTFTWKEVWPALESSFGLSSVINGHDHESSNNSSNNINYYLAEGLRYAEAMADKGGVWEEIVKAEGLQQTQIEDLANWWFLDAMFRLPERAKLLVRRPTRAHRLGFTAAYSATEALLYWVDRMREERLIPGLSHPLA